MNKFLLCSLLVAIMVACVDPNQQGQQQLGETQKETTSQEPTDRELRVAFYNVENLFDTQDNPQKADEDFLPDGRYKWTQDKYQKKLKNIARVINGIKPDVIGLAEVENRRVVEDLASHSILKDAGYQVVHEESSDNRGIDVAFMYRPDAFQYQDHITQSIYFPTEPSYKSRDLLVVAGESAGDHSLYFVINHWPSRRGGAEESEPRRFAVAEKVREAVDALQARDPNAHIILMGDFNDEGENKSVSQVLNATSSPSSNTDQLCNVMGSLSQPEDKGTLTHRGKWNLFDLLIVSPNMLDENNAISYVAQSAEIYNPGWLQVGFGRSKYAPKRAIFKGEFQPDGFSDHFPVAMNLRVK